MKDPGVYVDVVSGEPPFASSKNFDRGCARPIFTVPLEPGRRHHRLWFRRSVPGWGPWLDGAAEIQDDSLAAARAAIVGRSTWT